MNLSLVTYLKTYYISIKQWGTPFLQAHLVEVRPPPHNKLGLVFQTHKGKTTRSLISSEVHLSTRPELKMVHQLHKDTTSLNHAVRVQPWRRLKSLTMIVGFHMELIHCMDYRRSQVLSTVNGSEFPVNDFQFLHSFKTTRDLFTWIHFGCEPLTWEGSTFSFDDEDHKQCRDRSLLESARSMTRDSCAHKDREFVASAFVCIARNWRSNAHNTACIAIVWMAVVLCWVPIFVNWKDVGGWSCKGLSWSLAVVIDVQKMYCSLASDQWSLWQAEQICSSWPCTSLDIGVSKALKRMSE